MKRRSFIARLASSVTLLVTLYGTKLSRVAALTRPEGVMATTKPSSMVEWYSQMPEAVEALRRWPKRESIKA